MGRGIPLRTRVFTGLTGRLGTPIDSMDPADLPALRRRRARVQRSRLARLVVGRPAAGCEIADRTVSFGANALRMRVYRPAGATGSLPGVVAFHGGGFVLGDPEQAEWLCSQVAVRTRAVVVSAEYRLAPEHPYPAAIDDAWSATRWAYDNADELDIDRDRFAIMGESAGGTLAAVVAIKARDAGGPRLRAQALLYPAVEMTETFDSERRNAAGPIVTSAQLKGFSRMYLAGADGSDPLASPLRTPDLAGVAPALIQTAEYDPLRDNGSRYAAALRHAGVPVRYTCYRGAVHGYLNMPGVVPAAQQAIGEVERELRRLLQ
ncbi:alpha/beta hydrolase [Solicola gregarius]|uniref:Alpha/beta hydrolase n=1 Tax=Solicola gregarius TaxID=2908642 RepID=A0AA46TEZ1_9ACTN|nr:alpha/beta hydrolase [Solicola gregarius]UYM04119.1 alpha/beta hydrolase [Solicola gregarius]